ncbi:MAG: S-layer protein, partial [Candidatus Nanohalobium sp.]
GVLADDGNIGQVKNNDNVILVGGPAANSLTQELVNDNQTMPASQYTQGQGIIQLVDGFSEGNKALVVAGATGEDTRAAAKFLANYRNNQQALEGQDKVTISTSSGSVVSN